MKRTFIYKDEKSNKFWAIKVTDNNFTVIYGKTGATGQTQTKTFANADACQKEADKVIAKKIKEGYIEKTVKTSDDSPVTQADFYGHWFFLDGGKGEKSVVITADSFELRYAYMDLIHKMNILSWTPITNIDSNFKTEYPQGFSLQGVVSETGVDWLRIFEVGTNVSTPLFLKTDKSSLSDDQRILLPVLPQSDFLGTWISTDGTVHIIAEEYVELRKSDGSLILKIISVRWCPYFNNVLHAKTSEKAEYPTGYGLHGIRADKKEKYPEYTLGYYRHIIGKTLFDDERTILTRAEENFDISTLQPVKTDSKAEAQKAKQFLNDLNAWAAKNGLKENVNFSKPFTMADIEEAEKKLKVKLPLSYVEFVTCYGTFFISGEITGNGWGNDTYLLSPSQVADRTLEHRNDYQQFGENIDNYNPEEEPDSHVEAYRIINDGLMFCACPTDDASYVFVISSADVSGEMKARYFDVDDFGMNTPWFEGDLTFSECVAEIIENIKNQEE
jgi:predicted DNA-binding WGR domain protein